MKKSPIVWKSGPVGYGAIIEGLTCGIQRLGGASRPWRYRGFVAHVAIPGFSGFRLTLGDAKRDVEAHARQLVRERTDRIQALRARAGREAERNIPNEEAIPEDSPPSDGSCRPSSGSGRLR